MFERLFKRSAVETKSYDTLLHILSESERLTVDQSTSLTCVPYYAGIKIISESLATLPVKLYKAKANSVREPVTNHPISKILKRPNDIQTLSDLLKTTCFNLLHHGESFLRVIRVGPRPIELIPLDPTKVQYQITDNFEIVYTYNKQQLNSSDILHFKQLTPDGYTVKPTYQIARNAIKLYLAIEKFVSDYFEGGVKSSGCFTVSEPLEASVFKKLKEMLDQQLSNNHSIPLVDADLKYQKLGNSLKENNLSELKNQQVIEIARAFNLPAHLIQDYSGTSYNSVEALSLEYLSYTLLPIINNIESTINTFLITDSDLYIEFEINAFLRADTATRFEAYQKQILNGIRSVNEVRKLENLEPIPNGDKHLYPLNCGFVEDSTQEQ